MNTTPGTRLRYLRELLGYKGKQQEFADKVGLTQQSISNMERDKTEPANKSINKIFAAFPQVNISWLVSGQGKPLGESSPAPTPLVVTEPTVAEEPTAAYGCLAPDLVSTLRLENTELRTENKALRDELRQARSEFRADFIAQARQYNSVKVSQEELIARLYTKLDEYELRLGYRQPTQQEREQMQGGGETRMEVKPFGARYRETLDEVVTGCAGGKLLSLYPALVSMHEAA